MTVSARQLNLPGEGVPRGASTHRPQLRVKTLLITVDDEIWPLIGAAIPPTAPIAQVDSIEQGEVRLAETSAAILIWDARGDADRMASLARLQRHSDRAAIVVLDDPEYASHWIGTAASGSIVAFLRTPLDAAEFTEAFGRAMEEVSGRVALLGPSGNRPADRDEKRGDRGPIMAASIIAALVIGGLIWWRMQPPPRTAAVPTVPAPAVAKAPVGNAEPAVAKGAKSVDGGAEQIDTLLEYAREAMLERRYIEPIGDNALTYYRNVLAYDPGNGEARQGLDRLAGVLLGRAQVLLDQRRFDQALQALESARTIDPSDPRSKALDEKLVGLRSEFGTTQIQAAIGAQNFERAAALIDDAARNRALSNTQLGQLREELRRRREESEPAKYLKLAAARILQDRLSDGSADNAKAYIDAAKAAGASTAELTGIIQDYGKHFAVVAAAATDRKDFNTADRLLADARSIGVQPAIVAGVQRDLAAARSQAGQERAEAQRLADLVEQKMGEGKLIEPQADSAAHYLAQLRAADPKNPALTRLTRNLQAEILSLARAALGREQVSDAANLLQSASALGANADVAAVADLVASAKQALSKGGEFVPVAQLQFKRPIQLSYPVKAAQDGIEGWVELQFSVNPDGKVDDAKVMAASPPSIFDSAAVAAIKRARFEPTLRDGAAVRLHSKIRLAFKLQN